ncbi:hypothetical protein D3C86_1112090 [compost metagenome]
MSSSSHLIFPMPRRWARGAKISRVSLEISCCFSARMCLRVRMLWRRSASLIRMTRTSLAMATNMRRKFSAWRSSLEENLSFSSLVTPSTSLQTSRPNILVSSSGVTSVSSSTSCRRPAATVAPSASSWARIRATS